MSDGVIKIDTRIDQSGIDKGVKDVKDKLNSVGEGMKTIGENMTKFVTLPLVAMGTGAIKLASDFGTSQAQIQNSLGLTASEAELLNDAVKNVWKDGFGANLDEVTNSLLQVKQNMKGLNDGDLEEATKSALTLAQTFKSDVNEVTRAGGNIMKNFGTTSQEAFDLMAYGAQNGLNFSNEMFDNLSEYSADFARAGYSVDEMFQTLIKGSQTGTYNLEQLNDVVREFGIQGSENTKNFAEGINSLSPATQAMYQKFKDGQATMKEVMDSAIVDLQGVKSQTELNSIATQLFGSKWGDVGSEAILAMGGVTGAIDGAKGSMDGMVAVQEQTFGQRFQALLRSLSDALTPIGEILLDMAEKIMPKIQNAVETLTNWFTNLSPAVQQAVTVVGILTAAIGVLLAPLGMLINAFSGFVPLITKVIGVIKQAGGIMTIFRTVLTALTGPIGLVIGAITALIAIGVALYKNWDEISAFASKIWSKITSSVSKSVSNMKTAISNGFNNMKSAISSSMESAHSKIKDIWGKVTSFFKGINLKQTGKDIISGLINGLSEKASDLWNKAKEIANKVKDTISGAFEINSPSRWMRDFVAGNLYKGFEVGIDKQANNFEGTTEHMTSLMMPKPEQLVKLSPNGLSNVVNNLQQMLSLKIMLDSETIGYAVTPVVAREIAFEARG